MTNLQHPAQMLRPGRLVSCAPSMEDSLQRPKLSFLGSSLHQLLWLVKT